jgi:hypothetical protein
MKTVPVSDAQQTKQYLYIILCECGRYYTGETSRPLEVRIKEHKCNLNQGMLKKIKISPTCVRRRPQNTLERSEGPADWIKHHLHEIKDSAHMSLVDQTISQLGHLSHLDSHYCSRSQKTTTPSNRIWVKVVLVPYREFVPLVMTSILIVLWF